MKKVGMICLLLFPLIVEANERFFTYAEALWMHACPQATFVASELRREVEHPKVYRHGDDFLFDKVHSETRLHGQPEKWYWGYRVGVGYRPPCFSCWDWFVEWTAFEPCTRHGEEARPLRKNQKNQEYDRKVKGILIPHTGLSLLNDLILPGVCKVIPTDVNDICQPIRFIDAEEVTGFWRLKWNLLDFNAGRTVCLCECVHFRPHAAIRYAYIHQRHRIRSKGHICEIEMDESEGTDWKVGHFHHRETIRQKFQGVGPKVGIDTEWQLGCCWGVYGNLAASLLYGDVDYSDKAKASRSIEMENEKEDESEEVHDHHFHDSLVRKTHCSRALTDLQLGIFFRQNTFRHQYSLTVKLGWEHHYFFNPGLAATSFSNAQGSPTGNVYVQTNNDLSVQGATIFVGIDF